jgi:hypothetical protein
MDCDWRTQHQTVQGTNFPTNNLVFSQSRNGSAYQTVLTLGTDSAGNGVITAGRSIALGGNGISGGDISPSNTMNVVSTNGQISINNDVILKREAAANWRFGANAAAAPVAQTLSVQDASGINIAPAVWTQRASRGTGNASNTGKAFIWETPDVGASGTTLQTATEKMSLTGDGVFVVTGKIQCTAASRPGTFTVGTLPAATFGDRAQVTDALTPTAGATVVGGGAVEQPVVYKGGTWKCETV